MCPVENFKRMRVKDEFEIVARQTGHGEYEPSVSWEDYATEYMEFTDTAPTTLHAVDYLVRKLEHAGFEPLSERDSWQDQPASGKYYVVRGGTSIAAFVVGEQWQPRNGCGVIGTHIDSLSVQVKPTSLKQPIDGFEMIGVAPYAGALSDLWWDRDLGIGGRLVVRLAKKGVTTVLVRIPHPAARIATLAPHFGAPSKGPFNPETQKVPFIGLVGSEEVKPPTEEEKRSPMVGKHNLRLLRKLAKEADVNLGDVLEVDLYLYDTQPAALGGLDREFMFAPRIDDKSCAFTAMAGLIEAADSVIEGDTLSVIACYDHEEIGSLSRSGARGNLLEATVERVLDIHKQGYDDSTLAEFWANSFFLSADVTHSTNPNFSSAYLEDHKPRPNVGLTLSRDPNGNMITDAVTAAFAQEIARRTGNTLQQFQIRNGTPSGGTIGPYLSSKTGLRGVDIGIPQLSMHSIRATIGSKDIWLAVKFFKSFFKTWSEVDREFKIGNL